MSDSVYMGLAVNNNGNGYLATAQFTNVSIVPGGSGFAKKILNITQGSLATEFIYPNPSTGIFRMKINSAKTEKASLSVTDLKGKNIFTNRTHLFEQFINLKDIFLQFHFNIYNKNFILDYFYK